MTLPPVVSDLEVCPCRLGRGPHDWETGVLIDNAWVQTCRYCGGRKP